MLIFKHSVMGAGKTAQIIGNTTSRDIILKPEVDTRAEKNEILSRNGMSKPCIPIPEGVTKDEMREVLERSLEKTEGKVSIYIDEAQFLSKQQVDGVLEFSCLNPNVNIYCYGLLTDFSSLLFEGSKRLVEVADRIETIEQMDRETGEIATQNMRKSGSDSVVVIGKEDIYEPVCKARFFMGGEKHDGRQN